MSESYSRDVDAYIDGVQEFAKPILLRIRELFHEAFPDIEETIKWSCPHFEYKGIVAQMAGYKNHVRFIFWKGSLLSGFPSSLSQIGDKTQMGALNISSLEDFPDEAELKALILEAIDLNERGVKPPARPKKAEGRDRNAVLVYGCHVSKSTCVYYVSPLQPNGQARIPGMGDRSQAGSYPREQDATGD